ncbi:hypothetical protein [Streptomyces tropicalis]|uniref:Secreted protein n=1 Tax=Streptomyces tropicalis TaxID=3034234 RepID=A0ABT5ZYW4_9ACTN|nr:hypothetical protein [Streptomyces tropicalis]MDF3297583.1 hypothetical protein [Streptomyces tropicalis]
MRGLPARRVASTALCAALLVGVTGTVAVAGDAFRDREQGAAPGASVPGANELLSEVQSRPELHGELAPVSDLLTAALTADHGRLSPARAEKLGAAAKAAPARAARAHADRAADPASDTPAALQKAIDALVAAATSGDAGQVTTAINALLTGVVDFVNSSLSGAGLPTSGASLPPLPSLPPLRSLPPLPSLPPAPSLPPLPSTPVPTPTVAS